MASRAGLRENGFALVELRGACGEVAGAAWCRGKMIRFRGFQEELRGVGRGGFGGAPIGGVALGHGDLDRRDGLAAHDRVEVPQPLLAEQSDIQIDAVERTEDAHRIGAVLQNARRPDGLWRCVEGRQRAAFDIVIELLVVPLAAASVSFPKRKAKFSRSPRL